MTESKQNLRFEFKGNATDYFKIWIVNLFLSLISLGFYSPWAKVRNNQYLYGNSYLGNHSFEYTANPVRILIGRLIVVGSYFAFYISGNILGLTTVSLAILFIFVLTIPFLVRQSVAFRQRYTRYHGLNFKHYASIGRYYGFFIIHSILIVLTLGLILPHTINKFKELIINHTAYGTSKFKYEGDTAAFYMAYLIKLGAVILLFSTIYLAMIIAIIFSFKSLDLAKFNDFSHFSPYGLAPKDILFVGVIFVFVYVYFIATSLATKGLIEAWTGNIVYNKTHLADYPMQNKWRALKLAWIRFSNFFVILFSLGLLYPWTKIRALKYKLENMGFAHFDFHAFEADTSTDEHALGEESADFFDFDIGF